MKITFVPRYWVKLTDIFENKSLSSQQKNDQKQLHGPRGAIKERQLEVKIAKSAKTFDNYVSTNQSTERIQCEKYQIDHIYKNNINAKRKTGNNKSIILTKMIILQIAQKCLSIEIPIAEKPISIASQFTGFQIT